MASEAECIQDTAMLEDQAFKYVKFYTVEIAKSVKCFLN